MVPFIISWLVVNYIWLPSLDNHSYFQGESSPRASALHSCGLLMNPERQLNECQSNTDPPVNRVELECKWMDKETETRGTGARFVFFTPTFTAKSAKLDSTMDEMYCKILCFSKQFQFFRFIRVLCCCVCFSNTSRCFIKIKTLNIWIKINIRIDAKVKHWRNFIWHFSGLLLSETTTIKNSC